MLSIYTAEIKRLNNMYPTVFSYMVNTFNLNTMYRFNTVKRLEEYSELIGKKMILQSIKQINEMLDNVQRLYKERDRQREEFKQNMDEIHRRRQRSKQEEAPKTINSKDLTNAYKVLGFSNIESLPSQEDIRKNYKKMALKFHPDKNDMDTTELFLSVESSYELICISRGFTK